MTNLEKLMTDKEAILELILRYSSCRYCVYEHTICEYKSCIDGVLKWLESEAKEDDKSRKDVR